MLYFDDRIEQWIENIFLWFKGARHLFSESLCDPKRSSSPEVCFCMDLPSTLFWIFAIVMVVAALLVVGLRNIVHSALALIVVFAMAAGIYVLLNARFIAIVQILIYVGAVTILILFALMLTHIAGIPRTNPTNRQWLIAFVICVLVGATIVFRRI